MTLSEPRLSHLLGRRAVPTVAGLVIVSFILMAALLVRIASQQDELAATQARRFAEAVVERRRDTIAKEVKDYAAWGEAYRNLHLRTNVDWAFTQQNLGMTLYRDQSYADVLVIGPEDTISYAVVNGVYTEQAPNHLLAQGVATLVASARAAAMGSETKPVVGFVDDAGAPLLVGATVITPGGDPTIAPTAGPQSVLVFADLLTPTRLSEIGDQGFLHDLRIVRDSIETAAPSLPLTTVDGTGPLTLQWTPERPGHAVLVQVLPWIAAAGVAFAVLSMLVLRRTFRVAVLIEQATRDLIEAHRHTEYLSLHDSGTGLANRTMLHRYLTQTIELGPDAPDRLALFYIDLDRFKPINDVFGHPVGDAVLRETALRLRSVTREGDLVARVGGDEFVLVFRNLASLGEAEQIGLRLIKAVAAPIQIADDVLHVGLSIGVAVSPDDGKEPDTLLRHADIAMYQAKIEGGALCRLFSAGMSARRLSRIDLDKPDTPDASIHDVNANGQVEVVGQSDPVPAAPVEQKSMLASAR